MVAKRVNVLWAILGAVGGMALGAWYMGSRIQSPAEMAARTAAPAFRDMAPGTSGGDVRQLEEALAHLGFDPGTVDGNYDQKTSAAVERMYKKAGWDPFAPTREQRAAVAALEREWSDAARAQLAAEATRETALKAVAAARAIAEQNTRQASLDSA